jgi:hypothetical protein
MTVAFSKHCVELLERIERVSAQCAKGEGIGAKGLYFDNRHAGHVLQVHTGLNRRDRFRRFAGMLEECVCV